MRNREAVNASGGADHGPVTRRELEALRVRRGDPAPVLEYGFGEGTRPKLRKIDMLREARARHIEGRLKEIDGHVESEFACAAVSGRAKHDFEQAR